MTAVPSLAKARRIARNLRRDECGATLVEFTLVLALFLLIIFGLIDFGRLAYNYVFAEKAVQIASRIATVRPPVCLGVPVSNNVRGAIFREFGTPCSVADTCGAPTGGLDNITCSAAVTLDNADPQSVGAWNTSNEIWAAIENLLPPDAERKHLVFNYRYQKEPYQIVGFLGGPYTPIVTVSLVADGDSGDADDLKFRFASPLGALAGLATGTADTGISNDITFPTISVSLPGEDLSQGMGG